MPATEEGAPEHRRDRGPLGVPPRLLAPGGVDQGRQRLVTSVEAAAAHRCPDQEDPGEAERQQDKHRVGTHQAKQSGKGDRDGEQYDGVRAGTQRPPELRIGAERLGDTSSHVGGN